MTGARRRQTLARLIVFGAYLILTVMLTYPVAFQLATHLPIPQGVPGWPVDDLDPWHSLWILWFVNHSLIDLGRLPLSADILFYPRGIGLTYFSLITLPLLVSIPLVQLGGVVAAHNLLLLMSIALAAYATFLLVDHLVQDRPAAFLAGVVYAFCPYHMMRLSVHLFLVAGAVWPPLYVRCLIKGTREGRITQLLLAALCFLLCLLTNPYYPVFLVCFTGIYGLFSLWHPDPAVTRRTFIQRFTLLAACLSLLVLPVVLLALRGAWGDTLLYLPLADTAALSPDLFAFFLPSPYHFLWGDLVRPIYEHFTGNLFEQTVGIGYGALFLSLLAACGRRARATSFWLLAAMAFFVLSLGPFLHLCGRFLFQVDELPITIPLPYLLLHFAPILGSARAPSRFAVMLILCVAVLVGFGLRALISRCGRWRWGALTRGGCVGLASLIVVFEYVSVPLPTLDARIPEVYERIGRDGSAAGSVWDVPLNKGAARHQYYQTMHHKRLPMGFAPRPQAVLVRYADTFPMIQAFKDPDRFLPVAWEWNRQDALRLIDFFSLDAVVIHREYLQQGTVQRLREFLMTLFPVRDVVEEGQLLVFWIHRGMEAESHWSNADYRWDFDPARAPPFLFEGWAAPEFWEALSVAWSDAQESRLWVYFPRSEDMVMELRLLPFWVPALPPQTVRLYVNGTLVGEIELATREWRDYVVRLPKTSLIAGMNRIRVVYRYALSPAALIPGSHDTRSLAVAYDYLGFRRDSR